MTEEKFTRSKELFYEIKSLEAEKERWEKADAFHEVRVRYHGFLIEAIPVNTKFINFENVKDFALKKISSRLKELRAEFNKL